MVDSKALSRSAAVAISILVASAIGGAASSMATDAIVILDSWWNVDYARSACLWTPTIQACQGGEPVSEVRDFEDRVITHLAANPQCKGVHVIRYAGPGTESTTFVRIMKSSGWPRRWTLFFDFRPGDTLQPWHLLRLEPDAVMKGVGDPSQVARQVCTIVGGQGAKVN
jgi:hypothetical protein